MKSICELLWCFVAIPFICQICNLKNKQGSPLSLLDQPGAFSSAGKFTQWDGLFIPSRKPTGCWNPVWPEGLLRLELLLSGEGHRSFSKPNLWPLWQLQRRSQRWLYYPFGKPGRQRCGTGQELESRRRRWSLQTRLPRQVPAVFCRVGRQIQHRKFVWHDHSTQEWSFPSLPCLDWSQAIFEWLRDWFVCLWGLQADFVPGPEDVRWCLSERRDGHICLEETRWLPWVEPGIYRDRATTSLHWQEEGDCHSRFQWVW